MGRADCTARPCTLSCYIKNVPRIHVIHTSTSTTGKSSAVGRLSDYPTFCIGAAVKLFRLTRHDVVMTLTTPPLIGLLAFAVCRARRMRFAALVQGVYPDVGVALGTFHKEALMTPWSWRIGPRRS